jgi:hypothetical protein
VTIQPVPPEFAGQHLSDAQIAGWAIQAGFSGADLQKAVAIAIAESGGRVDATNHNTNGSTDYGVWQINSIHADEFAKYPQWWSVENADMAHDIYAAAGNSFSPWTTYTSGAYQMYMSRAATAAGAPDKGNVTGGPQDTTTVTEIPGVTSIATSLSAFSQGLAGIAKWVGTPSNWERVGLVLIGGALVVGALVMIADQAVPASVKRNVNAAVKAAAA